MTITGRVLRTIRRHALIPPGGRVLAAVSGGADSVALVHLLRELEAGGHVKVVGIAHFNHQLRGAEADADEAFCRGLAAALELPIECGAGDVRAAAAAQGRSIEDAARVLRYAFLARAADSRSADAVAVGHTRDDQAETFLLRLLRGSGARGLAGILPRAGRIVRPLLETPRSELRTYAARRGLAFREDATNQDLRIPRNRVRHELLPYLEREFSSGIAAVLAREAASAREDEDYIGLDATDLSRSIVLRNEGEDGTAETHVDAAALASLPQAIAARVARTALQAQAPGVFIGFDHIDGLLQFARHGRAGAALSLPGQQAVHTGKAVRLGPEPRRPLPGTRPIRSTANEFSFLLSIPGEVRLDKQGWAISAALAGGDPGGGEAPGIGSPDVAADAVVSVEVAADPLSLPLCVRSRRAGDRFDPSCPGGRKKLKDFLIDRKIPRECRDSLPLVVDGAGRVVWVVGHSLAADFRVTSRSRGVILLQSRRLGGLG
ncbi:MAG: tRNA lysidine(34) synthetase TilS [Acidobacteriota bacterium]|nr:tRNA lysidine(34) synthetase TilS [Acidobacteriota bacterium]